MAEHRIRFRGGWEWSSIDPTAGPPGRKTLPTIWTSDPGSPFRLVRRFGRPPIDPADEGIHLELLDVPGLVAIRWNGRELGRPPGEVARWSLPIEEPLLARNSLELEVDFRSVEPPILLQDWGQIALVISTKGSSPG